MASEFEEIRQGLKHDRLVIEVQIDKQIHLLWDNNELVKRLDTAHMMDLVYHAQSQIRNVLLRLKNEIAKPHWTETLAEDTEQP